MEASEVTSYGIAAFSVLFAVFAYLRPRTPKKNLGFRSQNFALVHDAVAAVPNLEVKYMDADVARLTVAKFWIWNSCGSAVTSDDVYGPEQLKIVVKSGQILYARRLDAESQPSQRRADVEVLPDGSVKVSLGLLNDGEQVGFTLIHSGEARNDQIELQGTLINGAAFVEGDPPRHRRLERRIMTTSLVVTALLVALCIYLEMEYLVGLPIFIVPLLGMAVASVANESSIADVISSPREQE